MQDVAAQKRGTILVAVVVIATLIAAFLLSGISWHISDALSSQPYSSSETNITAQINSDGSLLVTEQRTFAFSDKVTTLRWRHDKISNASKLSMRNLRVSVLDAAGNATSSIDLTEVPFQKEWRDADNANGIGPDTPCYSIDDENYTVYTFFEAQDATVVYTFDYTIQNGVTAWHDVAELSWSVVTSDWATDSQNVNVSLILPVPADSVVKPGENVYAWSHGPQNGQIETDSTAIITYRSPVISQGQWASLHIAFPTEWLTNLPSTKEVTQFVNTPRLTTLLSEEEAWFDSNTAGQMRGNQFDIALLAICLVLLVLSFLIFLIFGRDHKPQPIEGTPTDDPSKTLHPAIVGRLIRWNHQSVDDLEASIMRLETCGAISITDGENPTIQRASDFDTSDTDRIDRATLQLLFDDLAKGCDALPLTKSICGSTTSAQNDTSDKSDGYSSYHAFVVWQKKLTARVAEEDLFDKKSLVWQKVLLVGAVVLLIAGIALKLAANSNTLLGGGLPVAAIMALLANYLPRRTQKGQDLAAAIIACRVTQDETSAGENAASHETTTTALRDTLFALSQNKKELTDDDEKPRHRSFRFSRK